jgi:hypothetical protein
MMEGDSGKTLRRLLLSTNSHYVSLFVVMYVTAG